MSGNTRLLELLALLHSGRLWPATDLAERLEISPRTLRRDVTTLQELGYPISAGRGTGGGYSLTGRSALPPLMLSEDEAVAVVLGLSYATARAVDSDIDATLSALVKLMEVLPPKVRRRVEALRNITVSSPPGRRRPTSDVRVITTVASAARHSERTLIAYTASDGAQSTREVEPHDLVSREGLLYLVAFDLLRQDWRLFRVDRITEAHPTGDAFAQRQLPNGDASTFLSESLTAARSLYLVRATVDTDATRTGQVLGEYADIEPSGPDTCDVTIAADQLDWVAFGLASIGAPFEVHGPKEAKDHLQAWGQRLTEATSTEFD